MAQLETSHAARSARLQRHIRNLLVGLFLIAFAAFLEFAQDLLMPLVVALLIAMTFRPAVRSMARRGFPEWLAASGFIGLVILAGAFMAYVAAGPIAAFIQDAPLYAQAFNSKLRTIQGSLQAFFNLAEKIQQVAKPDNTAPAQEVVVRSGPPLEYLGQITGYSLSVLASSVLSLVIAAFLMASGDLFYAKLVHVLPTLTDKKTALRIVYDVEREVSGYLLIVTTINAGLGVAVAAAFYALGMPTPWLWGVVAFVLNFIPYVGAVTGIGMAAFMAVITFDSLAHAALVPLSYAALNGIENQFITPPLMGRRLQLNAVSILLALAFWTWLWGIAGTAVAVPLLVTVKVFCGHLESLAGIGEFLSARYPDEPPASPSPPADTGSGPGQEGSHLV